MSSDKSQAIEAHRRTGYTDFHIHSASIRPRTVAYKAEVAGLEASTSCLVLSYRVGFHLECLASPPILTEPRVNQADFRMATLDAADDVMW